MIPLRNKNTNIRTEVSQGKALQEKIKRLSQAAAEKSIKENIELNDVLADISKKEKFNRIQMQRLVEESNTIAYNLRYDQKRQSNDRRISFELASVEGIVAKMGSDAPPEVTNPNFAAGGQGAGEMNKAASIIESTYIHRPHAKVAEEKERHLEKIASFEQQETEKQQRLAEKEHASVISKIAHTLVKSEQHFKNANEVFNTMLSDAHLSQEDIEGISKKASEIGQHLVKTRRVRPQFVVTLTEEHRSKVANHLLGEYSLVKEAEEAPKVKEIKIHPTSDVNNYTQLVNLAKQLEKQQELKVQNPATAETEVK